MKLAAACILALLAVAFVAQTAEAAQCHVSSYKVTAQVASLNKNAMYDACFKAKKIAAKPVIVKTEAKPDGCVLVTQKVASEAAWNLYSNCEKSKSGVDNAKFYGPLKSAGAACEKYKSDGAC